MKRNRLRRHFGDRISKILRESLESDVAPETWGRIRSTLSGHPILSTWFGSATGIALGLLIRRGD